MFRLVHSRDRLKKVGLTYDQFFALDSDRKLLPKVERGPGGNTDRFTLNSHLAKWLITVGSRIGTQRWRN